MIYIQVNFLVITDDGYICCSLYREVGHMEYLLILREDKQNVRFDTAEREVRKQRISEIKQLLYEQTREITEYDE